MTLDDLDQFAVAFRRAHARPAWRPDTDGPAGHATNWFGGVPLRRRGEPWPVCGSCRKPMQFFVQLDLAALPAACAVPQRSGLLQVYYCSADDGECATWQPFSGTARIEVVPATGDLVAMRGPTEPLAQTAFAGWQPFADPPHPEDFAALGLELDYDFANKTVGVRCSNPPFVADGFAIDQNIAERIAISATGDKLGGWPYWVQSSEYPSCPVCGVAMALVLQIDSEDNLPYMFGDAGCAHVTQCRRHPEQLAFGWACS